MEQRMQPHEPSTWLREQTERVEAAIAHLGVGGFPGLTVVPLWDGSGSIAGTPEDRTCDRCRVYVPEGEALHAFRYQPRRLLIIVGGLCGICAEKEAWL